MVRLIKAWQNSARAFRRLLRSEAAFRQEIVLLALAVPVGLILSHSWPAYALLLGAILLVIIVEVLNTAIEAACDAISGEFHPQIQLAKDCGSLAVLLAIILAALVWGIAVVERFTNVALQGQSALAT